MGDEEDAMEEIPLTSAEHQVVIDQQDVPIVQPSDVAVQQPAMVVQPPDMAVQQPDMVVEQPGTVVQQPGTVVQQPGMVVQQPGMVVQQPGVMVQQPGMVVQQPGMMVQTGMAVPAGEVWMLPPAVPPNCPPGLAMLSQLDQLVVNQQISDLEVITGQMLMTRFQIKNSFGQIVYYAKQERIGLSSTCGAISMKLLDSANNEVIELNREKSTIMCFLPCGAKDLEVTCPPGTPIGYVQDKWGYAGPFGGPASELCDEQRNVTLVIDSPGCIAACGDTGALLENIELPILQEQEIIPEVEEEPTDVAQESAEVPEVPKVVFGMVEVGKVTMEYNDMARITGAQHFSMTFPMDLDAKVKATILASMLLLALGAAERARNRMVKAKAKRAKQKKRHR